MRSLISLILAAAATRAAELPYYTVLGNDAGAWPEILSSIGLERRPANEAQILVVRDSVRGGSEAEWTDRIERGAILILEGVSPLADFFGFRPAKNPSRLVTVSGLTDIHGPDVAIVWEKSLDLPFFEIPSGAQVFARERWVGAPMVAGLRRGAGAVLWIAAPPGQHGYERFPYLVQALCDLGLIPPFRSARLWAFFDSAYRSRVDLNYFAARWRKAGISALHVAAWHFFEPDAEHDRYLKALIEACHREGILVYAWLDLPHVSERFWDGHPEWREKTALLQDAQLDWRKLMNLTNRECFRAVSKGVGELAGRFDWDGINLAELYFESLQGIDNPSRFTPMNDDVRGIFRSEYKFDPIELFNRRTDKESRRKFLDFRSDLAARMQEEWIAELESLRRQKPYLELVLTHVDDRFDPGMRDAIGADAARLLPMLEKHAITILIEDPATVWHLGPQRYHAIAEGYRALTTRHEKLAIDLNIVNRYQNVYPTKQQTGTELLQLVHNAAANFPRVALYFESSLLPADLQFLPSAAAPAAGIQRTASMTVVNSVSGVGVPWNGPAAVDGLPWPVADEYTVWVPPGVHSIEATAAPARLHLLWLNGDLRSARCLSASAIEFSYQSAARAFAILERPPRSVRIDGQEGGFQRAGPSTIALPPGHHVVTITAD